MDDFNDIMLLDELYTGETSFITNLIEEVSKARAPYLGKLKKPITGNKDFIKIGDMIAKEFGFYAVTFMVPYDVSMNAFTYPITMAIDQTVTDKKPKFFSDRGLAYDSSTSKMCIVVAVTAGVWFNEIFSDREVVAAILHEIGHSFVLQSERMVDVIEANRLCILISQIFNIIITLLNPSLWINIPTHIKNIMYTSNKGKEIINQTTRLLAENKFFRGFNSISALTQWITKSLFNLFREVVVLFSGPVKLISIPIYALNKLFPPDDSQVAPARSQEFLSDSFATMYGLGPETVSFLTKIETDVHASGSKIDSLLTKIPVIGALHRSLDIPILYLTYSFTTHPSTPARINKILEELKQELKNSDLDVKTKKAVQSNIKELEKIKDEMAKPVDKKLLANGEDVKRIWLSFLMNKGEIDSDLEKYYTDLKERDKYVKEAYGEMLDINLI